MVRVIVKPDVPRQEMPRLDEYPVCKKVRRRRNDVKVSRKFRSDDLYKLLPAVQGEGDRERDCRVNQNHFDCVPELKISNSFKVIIIIIENILRFTLTK